MCDKGLGILSAGTKLRKIGPRNSKLYHWEVTARLLAREKKLLLSFAELSHLCVCLCLKALEHG